MRNNENEIKISSFYRKYAVSSRIKSPPNVIIFECRKLSPSNYFGLMNVRVQYHANEYMQRISGANEMSQPFEQAKKSDENRQKMNMHSLGKTCGEQNTEHLITESYFTF